MRKIIAVSFTFLLLACAIYSVVFFSKIVTTEYALYNALEKLDISSEVTSRRQKYALFKEAVLELEASPNMAANAVRRYQLKAKLYYFLSNLEVWPVKREQYLKQAIYNNYNAININHYALQPWLLELQMQYQVDSEHTDFFWSLANVLNLGKWDHEVLTYASFYCVLKWKKMPSTLKQPCSNALQNVSKNETRKKKLYSQLSGIYRFEDIVNEIIGETSEEVVQ